MAAILIRSLLCSLLLCAMAWAQPPWPLKPVRLIITNSAGSAPDLVARLAAEQLARATGQPWIVDNRPGGDGIIGAEAAARAAPDGYGFFLANGTAIAVTPHLVKSLPYDPERDFAPVAMLIDSGPVGMAVHPDFPAQTLAELISLAKAQPDKHAYSVSVAFLAVAGAWFNKAADIKLTQIQYKETPQSVQDALAGRVPVMFNSMGTLEPLVRSGKMRLLAVTSIKRLAIWPDTPAIAETIPRYEAEGWNALTVRAGAPQEIINRVNREMQTIVKSPQFLQPLQKFVWTNLNGAKTPAELSQYFRGEREKWGSIVRELGIKPR